MSRFCFRGCAGRSTAGRASRGTAQGVRLVVLAAGVLAAVTTAWGGTPESAPELRRIAEENARLGEERAALPAKIEQASKDLAAISKTLSRIEKDFRIAKEKEEAAGLTTAIGVLLRKKRSELPDVERHERNLRFRRSELSKVQLQIIDYRAERDAMADIAAEAQEILRGIPRPPDPGELRELERKVTELLKARRINRDKVVTDCNSYFDTLVDLDNAERALISLTTAYAEHIDERILWIRSTTAVHPSDIPKLIEALAWLVSPKEWGSVLRCLWLDLKSNPFLLCAVIVLFVLLMLADRRLRRGLDSIATRVKRADTDRFAYTLTAIVVTVLIVLPWPLILWAVGWRLAAHEDASAFAEAIAAGLQAAALLYLALGVLQTFFRRRGVADVHFRWRSEALRAVRINLDWLIPILLPAAFVVAMLQAQSHEGWQDTLGRLAFMAGTVATAIFAQIVFRPTGTVMKGILTRYKDGWLDRLRYVWYPILILLPLSLAALAALGYFYTAQQFAERLQTTLLFVLGVWLGHAMLLRWLFVARRRLAVERAKARRAAQAEVAEAHPREAAPAGPLVAEESLYAMSVQTRKLLQSLVVITLVIGVWQIWADVLPALGILNRISPWSTTEKMAETVMGPDGNPVVRMVEKYVAVTLADLILAALVVLLTLIAVKNIPGVLEITILQRLPLDPGVRFAIATLSRYVITVVGFIVAFGVIGVGWAKVQWLAAAVTVGLGFGLQEIFANFVSGLIILFERPMRVGDTVTVGDMTGTVTRIRIRATTITDWDRKELIVPNKEFITGRMVNWTLSDTIVRIVFPVGIAYGSDVALAEKTLLEVADANPIVLDDPAPMVVFKGFGDSALDFELRVYVPNMDSYLKVWHKINTMIDKRFHEAKIEIAFPQQDVHVRSIEQALPTIEKRERQEGGRD